MADLTTFGWLTALSHSRMKCLKVVTEAKLCTGLHTNSWCQAVGTSDGRGYLLSGRLWNHCKYFIFQKWQELISLSCSINTSSMLGDSTYQWPQSSCTSFHSSVSKDSNLAFYLLQSWKASWVTLGYFASQIYASEQCAGTTGWHLAVQNCWRVLPLNHWTTEDSGTWL